MADTSDSAALPLAIMDKHVEIFSIAISLFRSIIVATEPGIVQASFETEVAALDAVLAGLRSRRVEYFELSYQIGMLTTFLVMDSVARQNLPIGPVDVGRVTEEIAMLSSKLGRVRTQQATHAMLYQPRLDTLLVMTQQLYPARAQTDPTMPAPPPYSSS